MNQYRDFTTDERTFPVAEFQAFLARLHAAGQHYVPIVDSNLYAGNPANESDRYQTFEEGAALNAFIRNGDDFYYGDQWPGFSVWTDYLVPQGQELWTNNLVRWHGDVPYDGIWIDLSEPSSYCVGSCGAGRLTENPVHPPFALPGDPGNIQLDYPEAFNITNATEAASVSAALASQSSVLASISLTQAPVTTSTAGRTEPTPGVRNLNFPPYVLDIGFPEHAIVKGTVAPNATHNDAHNTTEYVMHNLFGHMIGNATYFALLEVFPNRRPFIIGRSTFAGSGTKIGHWGGDNNSKWGSMYLSISQMFQFAMAGMPMVSFLRSCWMPPQPCTQYRH